MWAVNNRLNVPQCRTMMNCVIQNLIGSNIYISKLKKKKYEYEFDKK